MKCYTDLSPAQRKWVDLVEIHFPEINDTITYKQLLEMYNYFLELRKQNKNYRVSKPLWLITNNAIERGVYKFPGRKVKINKDFSEMEMLYHSELAEFDIEPIV